MSNTPMRPEDIALNLEYAENLTGFKRNKARKDAALSWFIHTHGEFRQSKTEQGGVGIIPGKLPPCNDCFSIFGYCDDNSLPLESILPASTFKDEQEARYFVCEKHWRRRMRGSGYTDDEIRTIMIEQGKFSEAEADAAFAEDAGKEAVPA